MKRLKATLLALLLIVTLLPVTAVHAQETGELGALRQLLDSTGRLEEACLVNITRMEDSCTKANYSYMSQAPQLMQNALLDRDTGFTLYVYCEYDKSITDNDIGELGNAILFAAMEHTGDPAEGDYLLRHWKSSQYSISYYIKNGFYYFDISFNLRYLSTAGQERKVDAAVSKLIRELGLKGMSDYEKVRTVYDYITENVVYDTLGLLNPLDDAKFTAYGALVEKSAVCQGYASAFYRLMLELGIDCRFISGDAHGPHAWNIVELNGRYYNLDTTWDSTYAQMELPWQWFLLSPGSFREHSRDGEFNTKGFHKQYPMSDTDYSAPSHTHSYTLENTDPAYLESPADCEHPARYYYSCDCGDAGEEMFRYGEALGHDYDTRWEQGDGQGHWRACSRCDEHSQPEAHVPNVPAATEETEQFCTVCGYEMAARLDHVHQTVLVEGAAATCTEQGSKAYYTCFCGKWFADAAAAEEIGDHASVILDALGHSYTDGKCTLCGEEKPEVEMGDLTGDGSIDTFDALQILYCINGRVQLTTAELRAADVTGEGTVDVWDVLQIIYFINRRIDHF